MGNSLITNLFYASPYASPPPGVGTAGVTLQTDPAQSPTPSGVTNPVLVIRLRLASSPVVIGISPTSGLSTSVQTAVYQPSFPLSGTESYMIDVIWVPSGTPPENIDWDSAITSAPVTAAAVQVQNAGFNGTTLNAQLAYGASGTGVGAQVNLYSISGGVYVNIGSAQTQNNTVSVPITSSGYPASYFISAQAAIPANNAGGAASFSAPFSLGPPTLVGPSSGVPQAAKTISTAAYNGKSVALSWVLDTIANCVPPDSSLIQVLANSQVIASFKGGTLSATIPVDIFGQTGISIQVSTVAGNISNAPLSVTPITQAPLVTNVFADSVAGTVTATVAVPTNFSGQAWLMDGDIILAGPVTAVAGVVSFPYSGAAYNVGGRVGLSVVANIISTDKTITGPQSSPAVLLATAPALNGADVYTDPSDSTKWIVDLQWNRLPDAAENVASYTIAVFQGTSSIFSQITSGNSASLTFAKSAIDITKTQSVQLYATGVTNGNSPTQTLAALFSPPLLASLVTTRDQIGVTWIVPPVPSTNVLPVVYQPIVMSSGGAFLYKGKATAATEAAIPLSDIVVTNSGNIVVLVNVALGPVVLWTDASMATACSASPLLAAPSLNPVSAAAVTNISTLNWTTLSGASTYTINFTQGSSQTGVTATSFPLTNALTSGAQLGYAVLGVGTSNTVPVTGPASGLAFVPTNTADVAQVRFDGSNVRVEWSAVTGALCYNVSVYDSSIPAVQVYSATVSGTAAFFTITPVAGKTYTAYVQPVTDGGTGLCGTSLALFAPGIYLSQQPGSAAYPYVYPAQSLSVLGSPAAGPTPQLITLFLPELGLAAGALGSTPITTDPFTIGPSGNTSLPYTLTIAADALAWGFDTTPVRATLQSAYVTFLKSVETPPTTGLAGATPYGISLVQAAIGAFLPQTFAEQLYYNFGFSTVSTVGSGYVDLRPGMILRVSASDYISIAQNGLPSWINGYAGATIMDFEIGGYTAGANWRTGFDAFLNTLSAQGALTVSAPAASTGSVQAGLAGAVDLYYPQFVQPFYRLYFPAAISSPWGSGSNTTNANFTLTAAAKYVDLQNTVVDPTKNPTAYFRGRAVVEVMIKVLVNGNERLVAVGATLGNLLEQLGFRPATTSPLFKQLRVYRSIVPAITSLGMGTALGPQLEVRVDWNGLSVYGTGNGMDAMSLPLLPGDQIITHPY